MNQAAESCRRSWGSLVLSTMLSLLLHAGLAWALDLLPRSHASMPKRPTARAVRHVQVLRASKKEKTPPPQEEQEPQAPFAKTSADQPQQRPAQADFIGRHDSVASGGPDAPQRQAEAPLPTMAGRESEDEVVTFDQERQDGDLAHEGKDTKKEPLSPTPPPPAHPLAQGKPEGSVEKTETPGEGTQAQQPDSGTTAARQPEAPDSGEGIKLAEADIQGTQRPAQPPPAPSGQPDASGAPSVSPTPPRRRVALYDPTLASDAQQPGLRTHERRTRSTGRFVFGRRPSLNVAATERGRYEAEIYRRIARMWYAACDEHRGDIIPGSITVSLRLTKSGSIDSMDLVRRSGASLSQQSFSFRAIRQAALPPMPTEVQKSIIGRLYEMILTFHFD